MKLIKLTKGKFAKVDDSNFDYLNQWKWHISAYGYATRTTYSGHGHKTRKVIVIYMHRLILNVQKGMEVDHINYNPLDNRRSNIRIVTRSQNMMNRKLLKNNTSGFKGVSWNKRIRRWSVELTFNQKKIHIGHYQDIKIAAKKYDEKAKELFGEYSRINF